MASDANFAILVSLSVCHLLNDTNQSLLSAIYPILKSSYHLDFVQIGFITLAFQVTASMLQPVVGMVSDRRPQPFSLPVGMGCTLAGLLLLFVASSYALILVAAALVGVGSSVFHPEASRVARMASGGRYGFAQCFSFGLAGLGAAALGRIADVTSIDAVYHVCSFLPLIGLLTAFLPTVEHRARTAGT